jgi:putative transposase
MRLIAQVKLMPTPEQADTLKRTLETANAACEWLSKEAWQSKTFSQYGLHHLCYRDCRSRFGLGAQMTVRCTAKVSDAYKLDRQTRRKFKPTGSIAYDDRILTWNVAEGRVSIWTVAGRMELPFVCGSRQRELLETRRGESDLVLFRDKVFLSACCDVEEPPPKEVEGVLGVDLGVVNIAVDSQGERHSGSRINHVRHRHRRLRSKLQAKGTKSARRRLKVLSGREARFGRWTNHNVSKSIVAKAQGTGCAIALEELSGIRDRIRLRRHQRAALHSWSFYQLASFVAYKASRAGVSVVYVDPANTLRTCPQCGHVDKKNRLSQSNFSCVVCGCTGNADHFAALEISRRAAVNLPYVSAPPKHRRPVRDNAAQQAAR